MRAADQPSFAGQNVSSAIDMPSSIGSGWSSETSRLMIGFSHTVRPMPCPYCSANAASSLGKPNSSALGHSDAMSAVVTPGLTIAIALSSSSRQYLYASTRAGDA